MNYDPIEAGMRIQNLRKEKGLTQEQLATTVNISDRHLRNVESGERNASIDLMVALSGTFHVSLDYLILGQDPHEQFKKEFGMALKNLASLVEKM
jgi:transcriptional regulator with XRE-family HTH domain